MPYGDASRKAFVGPGLTVLLILATEIVGHGLGYDEVAVTLFLLALAPIAIAALRVGFWNSLVATGILAFYTLHYIAPHDQIAQLDAQGWVSFAIIVVLGVGMGWPMDRVRRREERLREEVHARSKELEARNRELTNANASLEAFGYVVSHDLKEPVRALENYLQAAREDFPSDTSRMYLEEAYEANRRLARLLHGLLSYSRTSSLPAADEPVDLRELVESDTCAAQYAALQAERGARITLDPDLPVVKGDRVLLAQLLGNLILNAIRHHPRHGGHVRLRSYEGGTATAHFAVEDDGKGFPPDVLSRFGLLETGRPATIKTGFGLAIAHRAANRLGGRLWLENRSEGGAAAHVELPAARPDALSEVRKVRSSPVPRNDPTGSLP